MHQRQALALCKDGGEGIAPTLLQRSFVVIFACLLINISEVGAISTGESKPACALAEELSVTSLNANLEFLFPSPDMASYDDAQNLGNFFASGLRLSCLVPFADNSHNLSNYLQGDDMNTSVPFSPYWYDCYHWWGASAEGIWIGSLYNKNDSLVEVKVRQPSNGAEGMGEKSSIGNWSAESEDDFIATAEALASSIGVSSQLAPYAREELISTSTDVYSGQVTVITAVTLSDRIEDLSVSGANSIIVTFIGLDVWSIDLFCFYDSPGLTAISDKAAINGARDFIGSSMASANVTILGGPWFEGYGLDQDSLTVVCILTATISMSGWPYPLGIEVLVDAQTGSGVSYHLYAGMPDIHHQHITELAKTTTVAIAVVGCVLVIGALLMVSWPPEMLTVILLGLATPLYSRLKKDEVLDQYKRGMIHGFIIANPGESFSEIKKALSIGNGTLVYHLGILQKSGHIISRRSGNLMRYYPSGSSKENMIVRNRTELQMMIINQIRSYGQCSSSELRKRLDVSRQTLHNNLQRLVSDHVLISTFVNGRRRYRITPGHSLDSELAVLPKS